MNRLLTHLLTFAAALALFTGCDDGGGETATPPAADAGAPDAPDEPDPEVPGAFLGVSADARSCEVMLLDAGGQLGAPLFGAAVEGRSLRRGDRLAVAFAHRADAPIATGAIGLVAADGGDGVQIESATCFDAAGRPLPEADAVLNAL